MLSRPSPVLAQGRDRLHVEGRCRLARFCVRRISRGEQERVVGLFAAGKFSQTVVNEQVEKWKDTARAATNAIVDTDWQPTAALREPGPSSRYLESLGARMKRGTAVEMEAFPHWGGLPPGQGGPATVASILTPSAISEPATVSPNRAPRFVATLGDANARLSRRQLHPKCSRDICSVARGRFPIEPALKQKPLIGFPCSSHLRSSTSA